tara:strand:- start:979 stop:1146 length:168 start_codon:yes stop_codon:yes gene_type:complete
MPEFRIEIREVVLYEVIVEARNYEAAERKVHNMDISEMDEMDHNISIEWDGEESE